MRYDTKSKVLQKVALNSQTISSDTTTNGVKIDTQGFDGCVFLMQTGAVSAGDVTMLIEDSADNVTFAAVANDFLSGLESATTLDTANTISRIGYLGKKRYVRQSAVTANSANLVVSGACLLTKAKDAPTDAS
jgi:hypothetical protein